MQISEESKERLVKVFNIGKTVTHYGWIPLILWLGMAFQLRSTFSEFFTN
nr:putative TOM complex subunit Tom7 [Schizosaccharomyces pombe]CAA16905.1 mitochondrial TOM complex subunit Tom7 (predicted) [Schizosaccharomyces pombe]|eukprot:NP_595542.1 putative TOM complex subunit Tom7 [Schizosaccharomyces pombe]